MEKIILNENVKERIIENSQKLLDDAYGYTVDRISVYKNFELWAKNKKGLYDVLSTSPNWNEEELCLVVNAKILRKVNIRLAIDLLAKLCTNHQIKADDFKYKIAVALDQLFRSFNYKEFNGIVQDTELTVFDRLIQDVFGEMNDKTMIEILDNRSILNYCKRDYGIIKALLLKYKVREGQKWSKVLNKIMIGEGLNIGKTDLYDLKCSEEVKGVRDYANKNDEDWYIDYYYNYNQFFAVLSDILSPVEYEDVIYVSINPIDYLTQSHGDNWDSCHSLRNKGCYHSATLTMMTDSTSLIAYTLPKKVDKDFALYDKKTRQSLFIGDNKNVIFQNSFYPSKDMSESKVVREALEELLANYLNLPNLWKRCNETTDIDYDDYLGYRDWEHGQEYARFHLKSSKEKYSLVIGHLAYTINDNYEYLVDEDTLEFNAGSCHHCDCRCGLTYIEYYDRYVCNDCLDEYYCWCEDVQGYRDYDDVFYLEDKGIYVAEEESAFFCEKTNVYFSETGVIYVEDYGYVSTKYVRNHMNEFYKCSNCSKWYLAGNSTETESGILCENCVGESNN